MIVLVLRLRAAHAESLATLATVPFDTATVPRSVQSGTTKHRPDVVIGRHRVFRVHLRIHLLLPSPSGPALQVFDLGHLPQVVVAFVDTVEPVEDDEIALGSTKHVLVVLIVETDIALLEFVLAWPAHPLLSVFTNHLKKVKVKVINKGACL